MLILLFARMKSLQGKEQLYWAAYLIDGDTANNQCSQFPHLPRGYCNEIIVYR